MKISAIYGNVNLLAMEEKTMSMFNHEARQFKFDVLKEISQLAYEGKWRMKLRHTIRVRSFR